MTLDLGDRIAGVVLGAAIGDAMGHPTEFLSMAEIHRRFGPTGVTGFELWWTGDGRRFAPYTDDTQMAEVVLLELVEASAARDDLDATMRRIAAGFVKWSRNPQGGHRAPGRACMAGCRALAGGTEWHEAGGQTAGGCGSVMRAYPFGILFHDNLSVAEVLREQAKLLDELDAEIASGALPNSNPTLSDYAELWLAAKSQGVVRPGVVERYLKTLAHHILPRLGHVRLRGLNRRHLEAWVAWAQTARMDNGKAYSSDTLTTWWRLLTTLVKDGAAELGISDPTYRVQGPRVQTPLRREHRTLSADDLARLLAAAEQLLPGRYAEIATLALTGMRPSELYGLRWYDVDLDRGVLTVQRRFSRGHMALPKTYAGRTLPLPKPLLTVLCDHRQAQLTEQHPGLAAGVVFPNGHGGYRYTSTLRKPLGMLADHLGLKVRLGPQVLRRTFNTLMQRAGVDKITLQAMIGHSSDAMTRRYTHVAPEVKREAAAKFANLVLGQGEG